MAFSAALSVVRCRAGPTLQRSLMRLFLLTGEPVYEDGRVVGWRREARELWRARPFPWAVLRCARVRRTPSDAGRLQGTV